MKVKKPTQAEPWPCSDSPIYLEAHVNVSLLSLRARRGYADLCRSTTVSLTATSELFEVSSQGSELYSPWVFRYHHIIAIYFQES